MCLSMLARPHIGHVLIHGPSCADPGAFFGSIAPRLQTRFYSISSSPLMHPKSIHITCAIVHDTTVTGVCFLLRSTLPVARTVS